MYMFNGFIAVKEIAEKEANALVVSSDIKIKDIRLYRVEYVSDEITKDYGIIEGDTIYGLADYVLVLSGDIKVINVNYVISRGKRDGE